MEVVWDKECWSQGPFLSLPRLDPVAGGDSGLAAVTSCPRHVPLAWHCAPNLPRALGWTLGAQPHGRFGHRGRVRPQGRGHSPIVPVSPAPGSSCARAAAESPPVPHSVGGVVQMGVPKSGSALRGLLLSPALAHPLPACGRPLAGWMRRETEARCWHVCVGFCQPQPFPLCSRRTARVRVPHPGQGWPGLSGCLGGRSAPCPLPTIWGR